MVVFFVPIAIFLTVSFVAILLLAGWTGGIAIIVFALRHMRGGTNDVEAHLQRKARKDKYILEQRKKRAREYEARIKRKMQPED
jgi:hypothetical protein